MGNALAGNAMAKESLSPRVRPLPMAHGEFPEREPYLYTSQFNIQGRLDPLTDNSHLSIASSLSPSREAVDETKIIKGVSR